MPDTPLIDVRPDHWAIISDILQKHVPDREVWAFGSRAKWTAKPFSDLDLAVIGGEPLSLDTLSSLAEDFSESELPYKVDVVDWVTLSEPFREIVKQDHKLLSRSAARRALTGPDLKTSSLKEMCELVIDCPHFTPDWTSSGHLVIRNQNIRDGRLDLSNRSYTHKTDFDRRNRRAKPQTGDIIFTREAPMGEVCMVPEGLECCIGQRQVLLRPSSKIDGLYLFYALRSPYVRHQIFWNEGTGSTVSNVRIPILEALKIPRLGKMEPAIGKLLSALDDKIELNRQINQTLEAMARAIFKDWFVDFGPTRAKMEGRAPYLAPDIWALFPDSLDDDVKPFGWSAGTLSEIIDVNPSTPLKKHQNAPYIDMAALPTNGPNPDPFVFREFSSGMRFQNGDTLFARITPCLENGKTAFIQSLPDDSPVAWGSTEFIVLRSKRSVPAAISYILARDDAFRAYAIKSMTGSSGRQRASHVALSNYPMVLPDNAQLWTALSEIIAPLFESMKANSDENQSLTQIRDLLLPKLMSGEIRIRDAEKAVEAVL